MIGAIASTSIGHSAIAAGAPVSGGWEVEHRVGGLNTTLYGVSSAQLRVRAGGTASVTAYGSLAAMAVFRASGFATTHFGERHVVMRVRSAGVAVTRFGGGTLRSVHGLSSLGPVARSGFSTAPPLQMVFSQQAGEPVVHFGGAVLALSQRAHGLLSTRTGQLKGVSIVHAGGRAPIVRFGGSGAAGKTEVDAIGFKSTQYGALALGAVRIRARGMAPGTRFGHLVIQRGQRC